MEKKYLARKFLIVVVVLAMIIGPIVYTRVRNIVAPPLEVALARQMEAHDENIDVINLETFDFRDENYMALLLKLNDRSYWYERRREVMFSFILNLARDNDYAGAVIWIIWDNKVVSEALECEGLRYSDCEYLPIMPFVIDPELYLWEGRGNP